MPAGAEVAEGLSVGSIELDAAERALFPMLPRLPHGLLRGAGAFRIMGARSKRLIAGSSGLCLGVAPDGNPRTDLAVGRAMERAWLSLTAKGLAVQPMMAVIAVGDSFEFGLEVAGLRRDVVTAVQDGIRAAAPEIAGRRPAFLMRFGYALRPSARVGRRPLEEAIEIGGGA
jgi:hypothetical protein